MDKKQPITDILAGAAFLRYDIVKTNNKSFREGKIMRHILIRGILAVIWLAAAVVSGVSGRFAQAALYVVLGGLFLYFACAAWKKENHQEGDR